jgi:carboxyl-terminal processing protease
LLVIAAALCSAGGVVHAQAVASPAAPQAAQPATQGTIDESQWGQLLWEAAREGNERAFESLLAQIDAGDVVGEPESPLQVASRTLLKNLRSREDKRAEKITSVREELGKLLAEEASPTTISKALGEVIELQLLVPDREMLMQEQAVSDLVKRSDALARELEGEGRLLEATDLFLRLNALHDISGIYRPDIKRLSQRQEVLRMYAPKKLYDLNNAFRVARGDKPLPPFNALNADYRSKLSSIRADMVERSLARARDHIESVPMNTMVAGALSSLRTLITSDLGEVFPGIAEAQSRDAMIEMIDREKSALAELPVQLDAFQVSTLLERLMKRNDATTKLPSAVLLHEFGNGATSVLDDYSQIIWPDELRRFRKTTEGSFVGVGVQIELNEQREVRIVTPLEGTPAQRAGIHAGDVLTKVNGKSVFGLGLDDVVDVITGPSGSSVVLTVERPEHHESDEEAGSDEASAARPSTEKPSETKPESKPEAQKADESSTKRTELEFRLERARIDTPSVKGWERTGPREDAWNWFVDQSSGIGYVRLSGFDEETTQELDRAIREMTEKGLRGLVFDLRFNPGGLLDQAVSIAQRFLPIDKQPIVMARSAGGIEEVVGYTDARKASLAHMPVVLLVNEGSASASEIVSGAVSVFSREKDLDAMVLGARSFGKGSVQNVWPLNQQQSAMLKITTAYYMLPDKTIIHRRPGSTTWGVEPNLAVSMLPQQVEDSILIRRNADIIPLAENGFDLKAKWKATDPNRLLNEGIDLQLESAMVLLKARIAAIDADPQAAQAANTKDRRTEMPATP